VGVRQASIGIRRMPSTNALRQVAQQPNLSAQRLNTPLPALDEDCALGQVPSNSNPPTTPKDEPGRLTKVRSAVQSKIPFWGNKEKQDTPNTNAAGAQQSNDASMDYTSGMVDVLDTVGMYQWSNLVLQINRIRS
jgi:hypothetical protein